MDRLIACGQDNTPPPQNNYNLIARGLRKSH